MSQVLGPEQAWVLLPASCDLAQFRILSGILLCSACKLVNLVRYSATALCSLATFSGAASWWSHGCELPGHPIVIAAYTSVPGLACILAFPGFRCLFPCTHFMADSAGTPAAGTPGISQNCWSTCVFPCICGSATLGVWPAWGQVGSICSVFSSASQWQRHVPKVALWRHP